MGHQGDYDIRGGTESRAAERIATEIHDGIHDNIARKADIAAVQADLQEMNQRLEAKFDLLVRVLCAAAVCSGGVWSARWNVPLLKPAAVMAGED